MIVIYTKEELEEAKKVVEFENSCSLSVYGWARAAKILATELTKLEEKLKGKEDDRSG